MTLEDCRAHVGAGVVYTPHDGVREDGVITSVGPRYVFVRYTGDEHGKATGPAHLTLLARA